MADNPDIRFGDFTRGEQATIAALLARMTMPRADVRKIRARIERIEQQAAARKKTGRK